MKRQRLRLVFKDVLDLQHPSSLNPSVVGITTKPKERLLRALTMEHDWIFSRNSLSFSIADSSLCARGQYP